MPELPEVETTLRGIAPHVLGQQIRAVVVRNAQLRWPVPEALRQELPGRRIEQVHISRVRSQSMYRPKRAIVFGFSSERKYKRHGIRGVFIST